MLNIALAIFLIVLSAALVLYIASLLLGAFDLGRRWERWRLDRYIAHAERGDRYLHRGALERALAEFRAAFYPHPARDQALAGSVRKHHLGLLSRLIAAADQRNGGIRLMSLARADRLFQERNVLQSRYLTARTQGDRVRLRELERAFRHNTDELRSALDALAREIAATRPEMRPH